MTINEGYNGLSVEEFFRQVYSKHKDYCVRFMQKFCSGKDYNDTIQDIYHDAILVLYEKTKESNFKLTCSTQTYLNSICRNQLLGKIKVEERFSPLSSNREYEDDESFDFKPEIKDWLLSDESDIDDERINAMMKALETMKQKGDCYELLSLVYYHKTTMQQIAEHFNYKSDQIARNKHYLCKEKLKALTFELLNTRR